MSDYEGVGTVEAVRIAGRVKWFDPGKGYGFIVPDDPSLTDMKDVLLHVSSLRDAGRDSAPEGAPITCDCARRPKGWQVTEVHELVEVVMVRASSGLPFASLGVPAPAQAASSTAADRTASIPRRSITHPPSSGRMTIRPA